MPTKKAEKIKRKELLMTYLRVPVELHKLAEVRAAVEGTSKAVVFREWITKGSARDKNQYEAMG